VKGDSKSSSDRVLPWLVHCTCHDDRRDFSSALVVLVGTIKKNNFLHGTLCILIPMTLSLPAQQARQAAVLDRLSLSMCLCLTLSTMEILETTWKILFKQRLIHIGLFVKLFLHTVKKLPVNHYSSF
jgi:hypothetical protein